MSKPAVLVQYVRRAALARPLAGLTDAGLLDQYVAGGPAGEAAFEIIVRRHGPTVLRVCRAALGETQADDAFQATFLVLIRRIGAARRAGCLGAWLFGTARRVCATARRAADRRRRHENRARTRPDMVGDGRRLDPDVAAAVHAEVGRLPAGEQAAVVLCDLAGLTYVEAATRLGLTAAVVRGRLARGRDRLRRRLRGRGVGPEAIWGVTVAVPAALVGATARAAMVLAGRAAGTVPPPVAEILAGGLEAMIWTKCKAAGLAALTAGVLIAGAVGLNARQQPGADPTPVVPANGSPAEIDYGRTSALPVAAAQTTPVADRPDPGDEVASLVRRAQRQQDRGDAAAAMKTLAEVDAAAKRWRRLLADQGERATLRGRRSPLDLGLDDPIKDANSNPLGAAARSSGTADVESRLATVEAKLDRLLRGLEGNARTPSRVPPPGARTAPETRPAPKGGMRPTATPPPGGDSDGEPRPKVPRNGNDEPATKRLQGL